MKHYEDTIVKFKPKANVKTHKQLELDITYKQSSGKEYKGSSFIKPRYKGVKNGK